MYKVHPLTPNLSNLVTSAPSTPTPQDGESLKRKVVDFDGEEVGSS